MPNPQTNIFSKVLFNTFKIEISRTVIMMTGDHNVFRSAFKILINKMKKGSSKLTQILTLLKYG